MKTPYSLTDLDTQDATAVANVVFEIEQSLFPNASRDFSLGMFEQIERMFNGQYDNYQSMDTVYHNLEHTLQATLCWARVFHNYVKATADRDFSHRFFRIGLVAILMHDIGYLKEKTDEQGTGAKFTFVHERRSCEMAQVFLADKGWEFEDIFAVQHLISCTGPRAMIDAIPFRNRVEKILGQMVCTADYLGQMSDPGYLDKLPVLFAEFEESDDFRGIPKEKRFFKDIDDLVSKTPGFWRYVVIPKLDGDCGGYYRYLAEPYPDGPNPYLLAIEDHIASIEKDLKQKSSEAKAS